MCLLLRFLCHQVNDVLRCSCKSLLTTLAQLCTVSSFTWASVPQCQIGCRCHDNAAKRVSPSLPCSLSFPHASFFVRAPPPRLYRQSPFTHPSRSLRLAFTAWPTRFKTLLLLRVRVRVCVCLGLRRLACTSVRLSPRPFLFFPFLMVLRSLSIRSSKRWMGRSAVTCVTCGTKTASCAFSLAAE